MERESAIRQTAPWAIFLLAKWLAQKVVTLSNLDVCMPKKAAYQKKKKKKKRPKEEKAMGLLQGMKALRVLWIIQSMPCPSGRISFWRHLPVLRGLTNEHHPPPHQKPGSGHSLGNTALKVRLVSTAAIKDLLSSSHPPSSSWPRRRIHQLLIDMWKITPRVSVLNTRKIDFSHSFFCGSEIAEWLLGSSDWGPFHKFAFTQVRPLQCEKGQQNNVATIG